MKKTNLSFNDFLEEILEQAETKLTAKIQELTAEYVGKYFTYKNDDSVYQITCVYLTSDGRMIFGYGTGHTIDSRKVELAIKIA